jgi:hypothetical protein
MHPPFPFRNRTIERAQGSIAAKTSSSTSVTRPENLPQKAPVANGSVSVRESESQMGSHEIALTMPKSQRALIATPNESTAPSMPPLMHANVRGGDYFH